MGGEIEDTEVKRRALKALVEKLVPGRWGDAREPTDKELRATSVLRIPLEEASAKVRSGPPIDDDADYGLPIWAGVLGLRLVAGEPEPDRRFTPSIECPEYVTDLVQALR